MENIKSSSKISFGCMAWPGVLLSIAIIAIRAFQANAQPIESWSVFSWFLMMLPIIFPVIIWIALYILWFICTIFIELCSAISK